MPCSWEGSARMAGECVAKVVVVVSASGGGGGSERCDAVSGEVVTLMVGVVVTAVVLNVLVVTVVVLGVMLWEWWFQYMDKKLEPAYNVRLC